MQPSSYRTVAGPVVARIEEKRSVFECWLRRADDEAAARAVVEEARSTHWDARHHCSAFVLGPDGATVRSNDDGEPAGTAGTPMLEALTHSGLSDVVAVVTRWFGGTLLGTGGLVRAYGDAVRASVAEAEILTRLRVTEVDVRADHAIAGRLEHDLRARGIAVPDVSYGEQVTLRVQVPADDAEELPGLLASLTSGAAEVVPGSEGSGWLDVQG
ncbi:YigZ family protein [Ornithinimicrobium humiphilum]|uniref:Putative YigZ family protein n=1 Tax=Ornithinimicrobium humiphilum TaxID=125288 RepID=A0A543K7S9_9MICO|nr:YigZ family protein [Ornithinimicrobium humiphilum]TQM91142.1 putative YigZ family protein [Ornithinimicrobium humiphilum]